MPNETPKRGRPESAQDGSAGSESARPLISVLTPSYNQAKWIGDCLNSVACQTYPAFEHIVCDGGSTDGTVALLEASGAHVTWVSEPDRGQSHALNKAFGMSRGEIIGWMNSDDAYFDCGVFSRVAEYFARYPEVDVIYGHCVRIDEDGRVVWVPSAPPFSRRRLKWLTFIGQPAVFMRRSALAEPLIDESFDFSMDWELWLRLSKDHRFKRVDDVLAADRYQPERKNVTHLHVLEGDIARMGQLYGTYQPWFWNIYLRFYDVRRRLAGGRLIHRVATAKLAFDGYVEGEDIIRRRQLHTRRSLWDEKDLIAGS
jgi:glycosyltransferase involved in cell wall biosynthesis